MLASIWGFVCNLASIAKTVLVGSNTPAMVANKTAANQQGEQAKVEKDVASGDASAVGKDISL